MKYEHFEHLANLALKGKICKEFSEIVINDNYHLKKTTCKQFFFFITDFNSGRRITVSCVQCLQRYIKKELKIKKTKY